MSKETIIHFSNGAALLASDIRSILPGSAEKKVPPFSDYYFVVNGSGGTQTALWCESEEDRDALDWVCENVDEDPTES